jgi:hypothetical protein
MDTRALDQRRALILSHQSGSKRRRFANVPIGAVAWLGAHGRRFASGERARVVGAFSW